MGDHRRGRRQSGWHPRSRQGACQGIWGGQTCERLSCPRCHLPERAAGFETTSREARAWVRVSLPVRSYTSSSPARRTAYIHGLDFCTGDFVIIMDADFSHHVGASMLLALSDSHSIGLAQIHPTIH